MLERSMIFCVDRKLFVVCTLVEIVIIIVLTEILLHYIITSFDRLFNTKFVNQSRTRKHTK